MQSSAKLPEYNTDFYRMYSPIEKESFDLWSGINYTAIDEVEGVGACPSDQYAVFLDSCILYMMKYDESFVRLLRFIRASRPLVTNEFALAKAELDGVRVPVEKLGIMVVSGCKTNRSKDESVSETVLPLDCGYFLSIDEWFDDYRKVRIKESGTFWVTPFSLLKSLYDDGNREGIFAGDVRMSRVW